jgi:ketosteroid isomerase-like protein
MGESNLETLRRAALPTQGIDFAAFMRTYAADDESDAAPEQAEVLARLGDLFDPDVEIDATAMDLPGFGVYRGPDAMVEFWLHWLEEWEDYSWTFTSWSEQDEHVIVETQGRGTGRTSGALVIWNHCTIYTFRDGKVIRWTLFRDRASAMAALDSLASTQ